MQSTPFVNCHAAQDWGSPALTVVWQSADSDAGFEQLAVQNVLRSSQLWSGGAPFPASGISPGGSGGSPIGMHAPCDVLLSWSPHVTTTPPTQAVCPQASVRLSAFCSTAHVQLSLDDEHAPVTIEKVTSASTPRTSKCTAKQYSRFRRCPHFLH
jgi:hypothetical protein